MDIMFIFKSKLGRLTQLKVYLFLFFNQADSQPKDM